MLRSIARKLGLFGRTSRTTLVHFLILCLVAYVPLWFLFLKQLREYIHKVESSPDRFTALAEWLPWIQIALLVAWTWLTIRRVNDQGRPGWIALIPAGLGMFVIPAPMGITLTAPMLPLPPGVATLFVIAYLVVLLLPGTIGPNRYGPDPRGWKSRQHYMDQQRALGRR